MDNERALVSGLISYRVVGPDGRPKPVFQENRLFLWLLRKRWVGPRFPKIPYLLGRWGTQKEIAL